MPQRILIHAVTGSGKSTLAARLAAITGLPWHDVDALCWRPGWVQIPVEEQCALFDRITAQDRWILDTAYGRWRDLVVSRADLVVALDYPRWVSLSRLLRRTLGRVIDKQPICNGNVETWRGMFADDSIIRWHFSSFRRKHDTIAAWIADPSLPTVVRLTSPRETEQWLAWLAARITAQAASV